MILKGSQRSGARELARHLMNGDLNEHVTVHELRGFVSETLEGALEEADAVSRGTQCKQHLFSLSLNPPETADVPISGFEQAIDGVEKRLGLQKCPRIVVFHEKNGRRHCHAVWSRIDSQRMCAVHLPHYKWKLQACSRELFLKHGWEMPKGYRKGKDKACASNFTRQEWQQAERIKDDPRVLKGMFKGCWERSDDRRSFAGALEANGYYLARGDRRGYVAVDFKGEVYSLTRWLDVGSHDLKKRIGPTESLPSIEQAKGFVAARMTENLACHMQAAKKLAADGRAPLLRDIRTMIAQHRKERADLTDTQKKRHTAETSRRSQRLSRGVRGIWERITGKYQSIRRENELEVQACLERDRQQLHGLVRKQLEERQELQKAAAFLRVQQQTEILRIQRMVAQHIGAASEPESAKRKEKDEKDFLAKEIERVESRLFSISGDIGALQAALENNLLSDGVKAKIKAMIERAVNTVFEKQQAVEFQKVKSEQKAKEIEREIEVKRAEYDECIKQRVELQKRQEQEFEQRQRQIAVNREFYNTIMNMSYSLIGIPPHKIIVAAPPPGMFDEKVYVRNLERQSNKELLQSILKPPPSAAERKATPPQRPEEAVIELRQSVLQVKEALRRSKAATAPVKPEPRIVFNKGQNPLHTPLPIRFGARVERSPS